MRTNDATSRPKRGESGALATTVTNGPIWGSTKRDEPVPGHPDIRFPVRRMNLINGEHFDLCDSSGVYTDERVCEVRSVRGAWQLGLPAGAVAATIRGANSRSLCTIRRSLARCRPVWSKKAGIPGESPSNGTGLQGQGQGQGRGQGHGQGQQGLR